MIRLVSSISRSAIQLRFKSSASVGSRTSHFPWSKIKSSTSLTTPKKRSKKKSLMRRAIHIVMRTTQFTKWITLIVKKATQYGIRTTHTIILAED